MGSLVAASHSSALPAGLRRVGTGLFCFLQVKTGAHSLSPTARGVKGVGVRPLHIRPLSVVCVCVLQGTKEPGPSLMASLLALQVTVQWVVLAAAGRAWSSFGTCSLDGLELVT